MDDNPWAFNSPPTAGAPDRPKQRDLSGSRAVVFGHFRNPAAAVVNDWNVGPNMSIALAQAALNHGEIDAWIDPPLAGRVETLVNRSAKQRHAEIKAIQRTHDQVRYVVYGRVTDFAHTVDFPVEAQRWGLFGRRNEAVVAIQFDVFDLKAERVVVSDHVFGTAKASKTPSGELYQGIGFGSYMFWNSPLGLASTVAIENALEKLNKTVPTTDEEIRIVKQTGDRKLQISAESNRRYIPGRRYFVWLMNDQTGEFEPVFDPDTNLQLEAYIASAVRSSTTALLKGAKPETVDLRGAVLRTVSADEEAEFQRGDTATASAVRGGTSR